MELGSIVVGLGVFAGCGGGATPAADGGDVRMDVGSADGGVATDVLVRGDAGPCARASDCDDGVDCTTDACTPSGVCTHVLTPALCGPGESCSPLTGCTPGRACATTSDCMDDDACTTRERCDPAARVCLFSPLDGDMDGDPPRVCGGMDCDDSNPLVSSTGTERCNGADDDCDTRIDEDAAADCGAGGTCSGGACTCGAGLEHCVDRCIDTTSDDAHCGGCGLACEGGSHCQSSECRCADGTLACGLTCVDDRTDRTNCGGCFVTCADGESCVDGACTCAAPSMACGGVCTDVSSNPFRCGDCTHVCAASETCINGTCAPCGGVGQLCCSPLSGAACANGAACSAGLCPACGELGQACCGASCNGALACMGGVCATPACSIADGALGAHCAAGLCMGTAACFNDLSAMSVDQVFGGVRQGVENDPAHPGYARVAAAQVPANDPPFHGFLGTMCTSECDLDAATDGCGTCATCSGLLSQNPLVQAFGGARLAYAMPAYANSGSCRLDCAYDPATRGACPAATTCDAFSEVCVEQCTTDAECNMNYGAAYDGELLSLIVGDERCDTTVGRCVPRASVATAHVGDACDTASDCAPGVGMCFAGGLCGALECGTAGTACDGGRGICLGTGGTQTVCLRGCNTVADCGAGNVCAPVGAAIGGYTGYCIGVCNTDTDCAATETCNDANRCVPRCTVPGGIGVAAGCASDTEFCRVDHAGATYGFCEQVDRFCGAANSTNLPAASSECATGYVCDEMLAGGSGPAFGGREVFGDGHCTRACTTNADCTAIGTRCVTNGPYLGLCRRIGCTMATDCASGQSCDTARAVCVEAPPIP
ncbi:MAG: MopE-related protein [Sandaracinus sp.]